MRILKYRTGWSHGYGSWEYKILMDADEIRKDWGYKNTKEYLEHEVFNYIHGEHNFSEHYRGITYNILYSNRLSKKVREQLIKKYTDKAKWYKESSEYCTEIVKELNGKNPTSDSA